MRKLLLLFLVSTKICTAQTIETFLSPAFPTNLVASKDGNTIAWVFNDKGFRNIYIAESPGFIAKKITNYIGDDGVDISNLSFTPTGSQIVFVRGNASNNNGEPANPAFLQTSTARNIWVINKEGTGLRKILAGSYFKISPDGKTMAYTSQGQAWTISLNDTAAKAEKLFQSRGGQTQLRWSPDGSMLAFVSNRNDHAFIGIYHFTTKSVAYVETSMDQDVYPAWSPDSKQLAYIRIPNMNNVIPFIPVREGNPWSIKILDLSTGKSREVWKADKGRGSVFFNDIPVEENLLWWTAESQLVFPWEKDGWQHLYALSTNDGKIKLLTPGEGEVENVTISADRSKIYYTTNISDIDRRHIWELNVQDATTKQITKGNEIEWSPVVIDGGLAILHSSALRPAWPAIVQNNTINEGSPGKCF
jgi:Tol biopolymer transport system component